MLEVYSDHVLISTGVHGHPHHRATGPCRTAGHIAARQLLGQADLPRARAEQADLRTGDGELAQHHADTYSALVARGKFDTYMCCAA